MQRGKTKNGGMQDIHCAMTWAELQLQFSFPQPVLSKLALSAQNSPSNLNPQARLSALAQVAGRIAYGKD